MIQKNAGSESPVAQDPFVVKYNIYIYIHIADVFSFLYMYMYLYIYIDVCKQICVCV